MSSAEKAPSISEGLFTCADLYWRAMSALLAKSTARVLSIQQATEQGRPLGFLDFGGNTVRGSLPLITLEDDFRRPVKTVPNGTFAVSDDHYIGLGDYHSYGRSPSLKERQASLAAGTAPIHISVKRYDFERHYDLFYPDKLEPGERLHSTIYPVNPIEQQYQLPDGWPAGQPLLTEVSLGYSNPPIDQPHQHENLSHVYNALGSIVLQ